MGLSHDSHYSLLEYDCDSEFVLEKLVDDFFNHFKVEELGYFQNESYLDQLYFLHYLIN